MAAARRIVPPLPPPVVLIVSDLHLGRPGVSDAADVRAFAQWLGAHGDAHTLVLLGDVSDVWIEHRHLVPRLPVRFAAALAAWTDAGKRLLVFAGNHDPWHRSFFQDELGAEVVFDALDCTFEGQRVHLHHGDGRVPGGLYRRLRPLLRHRLPVALYRLLPADLGLALAQRTSARTRRRHDPTSAARLRAAARAYLQATDADAVVFGHSHAPDLAAGPGGPLCQPRRLV